MDSYSKFIQSIIAIALVWIAIRPFFAPEPVDAQSIADVRIVGFDVSTPLPVVNGGPPFPVNIVDSSAPVAVTITGALPVPIVTR